MKTVVISRNSKELARVPLNRRSLLAGRSPSCEAVIRTKGIQPVQFMIEHVSENLEEGQTADFNLGFWTLIDISEVRAKEAEKRKSSSGAGIVLDAKKQNFNGFEFQIIEDTLQETDLKKGVLSRGLDQLEADKTGASKDVLEIVHFRKDLDIVSNITHIHKNKTSKKFKPFPQALTQLVFEWPTQATPHAVIRQTSEGIGFEVYKKSEAVTDIMKSKQFIEMYDEDVILLETEEDIYYLRLVPNVEVVLEKFSWSKDFIIGWFLAILAVISMLTFIVKNFEPEPEKTPEPPRVVQIEIPPEPQPEPPPTPEPEPPAPEPVVEKTPPPPKPVEKVAQTKKPEEPKPEPKKGTDLAAERPGKAAAVAPNVIQRPNDKPKAGLNNNSEPKNVNTVGLLGSLKKGQTPTNQKISADKVLNQGIVSETMTGKQGNVVVNKAPSGVIGKQTQPIDPDALAKASTTLSGAKTVDTAKAGSIALSGGSGKFTSGSSMGGLNQSAGGTGTSAGSGVGSTGSGFDRGEAVQAVGGLDKEAVRKALRENRRAIANCYETALLTKKELNGRMTFRWVISPVGDVTTIKLNNSDLNLPNFESCVESVIKSIKFPQAPNKSATTVIYPFAFQGKK